VARAGINETQEKEKQIIKSKKKIQCEKDESIISVLN